MQKYLMVTLAAALDSPLLFHPAAVRPGSASPAAPSRVKIFGVSPSDGF